jgi:uncharacterized Zn finger protein (UPF0148 family)
MSQLLLSGATMLGESCPDCAVPLFKKNDDIFCPNCERKAVYAKNKEEIKAIEQKISLGETIHQLKEVLTGKISMLTNQLASSDTPEEINKNLVLIERILELLKKIS